MRPLDFCRPPWKPPESAPDETPLRRGCCGRWNQWSPGWRYVSWLEQTVMLSTVGTSHCEVPAESKHPYPNVVAESRDSSRAERPARNDNANSYCSTRQAA